MAPHKVHFRPGLLGHTISSALMTIAVCVKVNDAVVLAADSATTFFGSAPKKGAPPLIAKVYNHADKIANLYKGLPIGMTTSGSANIGTAAIPTLANDLR